MELLGDTLWSQTQVNHMELLPLHENGWIVRDNELSMDWDSADNRRAVRHRVSLLLKGCSCKSGCETRRM